MPVTMISSAACHRDVSPPVVSLRVMSFAPSANTSMSTHVVTIVPLSTTKP
jgi:hypothetical protein